MGGNKTPIMDEALLRDPSAEDWIREYHGRLRRGEIEGAAGPAPERFRRISIVESAAIQTFPRDYKFCGNKSAIYTQIENAVPCRLAESVAAAVAEVIFGKGGCTMKLSVESAKITVYRAYENARRGDVPLDCACRDLVDDVLEHTHLTYKYILVTALTAKATDESVNPLRLQAKSALPGAYDARSICHGVIVPFDTEVLNKALGGSNEPFLNKPARFPELSTSNAVRGDAIRAS